MTKLPNHTALKEWASVIDALGAGEQVILIRKGGIADPAFGVEAERFYLYPTYFHQPSSGADAVIRITHWCEVVRTWRVGDLRQLRALERFVVFSREALEERYRFRSDQALHILGVRTWRLSQPAVIEPKALYAGCRSWISIDEEIAIDGSIAAVPEPALLERLNDAGETLRKVTQDASGDAVAAP